MTYDPKIDFVAKHQPVATFGNSERNMLIKQITPGPGQY